MKSFFAVLVLFVTITACGQQDKSKRPSPPVQVKGTIAGGATIIIDYSQPSLKGRTIGKDVEPNEGKVWRTGANEATTFETDKDVKIEGQSLAAGKYSLFTIKNGDEWTIIFNKTANQWGAYEYKEAQDALRVKVKGTAAATDADKLIFAIDASGKVSFSWGEHHVAFQVK
jgi:Protein of unknown function (DUF2911)